MKKRLLALLAVALSSQVWAQVDSTQPAPTTQAALGQMFQSRIAGIEFCPPAGGRLIRQINSGDIVRFIYPGKSWDLHCKLVHLTKPLPLSAPVADNSSGGLLEMTVDELKASNPSARILFQNVKDLNGYKVGLIEARYNTGADRAATREAIFRENDQNYYLLQLTTPGKPRTVAAEDQESPDEFAATQIFQQVLTTVKLLDRSDLKKEQIERLMRTRLLFTAWDVARLKQALVPEQFMRVIRDGKDVGYLWERDRVGKEADNDGVEIVLKSHVVGDAEPTTPVTAAPVQDAASGTAIVPTPPAAPLVPTQAIATKADRTTKMFVSFDRRHEQWSTVTLLDNGGLIPEKTSEMGNSDAEIHRVLQQPGGINGESGDKENKDRKEPVVTEVERDHLSVSNYAKVRTGVPVERDLPVYYIPLAITHLLPRLVPLDEPRTYMFASYVSEEHEVMARYVDVLREQDVILDGTKIHAIPVSDRIGVEGSATTHYMSHDGQWLGSVNEDQKVMLLPADRTTIQQLWKEAKFEDDAP